jgi:NDP-sugar pyrophosphorylase family protein
MLEFHERHGGLATMAVREYDLEIPYGVVTVDNGEVLGFDENVGGRIVRIDEKPVQRFFVNAGIYVLSPESFDHLPTETPFDMPMLFDRLRQAGATMAFPLRDYWVDVGRHDELEMAKDDLARAQSRATLPDR